jgi:putative solute:sodium symporter small subunit
MSPEIPILEPDSKVEEKQRAQDYWRANLRLVAICLVTWFLVSYGCGILFAEFLNQFQFFGFKLGFWFAQQGSIYAFLLLILFYVLRINALDRRFGAHEEVVPDEDQEPAQ